MRRRNFELFPIYHARGAGAHDWVIKIEQSGRPPRCRWLPGRAGDVFPVVWIVFRRLGRHFQLFRRDLSCWLLSKAEQSERVQFPRRRAAHAISQVVGVGFETDTKQQSTHQSPPTRPAK